MSVMIISIMSGVSILLLTVVLSSAVLIRNAYIRYDINKTKEEELEILRKSIKSAKEYFRKTYNTDFDDTVWTNVKENTNFIIKLIENHNIDDKLKYYDRLFKMLYETGMRLKQDYDNVQYIMAPLHNLREELVEDQLTYIREHSDL